MLQERHHREAGKGRVSYTESVWTEGVLGQTAELRGEVLSWSQVGWWSFAHFARVWAIVLVLGCDGTMAHLALWSPGFFWSIHAITISSSL